MRGSWLKFSKGKDSYVDIIMLSLRKFCPVIIRLEIGCTNCRKKGCIFRVLVTQVSQGQEIECLCGEEKLK